MLLLSQEELARLQVLDIAGQRRLVFSDQQAWVAGDKLLLRGLATQPLRAGIFPALAKPRAPGLTVTQDGALQYLAFAADTAEPALAVQPLREARTAPRILTGGLAGAALQPIPEAFGAAASWQLKLPAVLPAQAEDVLLELDFVGDIGRLFAGTRLLDDWYFNGQRWQVGLRQFGLKPGATLNLSVLPLRADAPIYIDAAHRPRFAEGQAQVAELRSARLLPVRRVAITP
ncbi:hypothetical protein DBR42_21195 [Pelomonas sp. HMWF004]|nr:hypothetical protein DBR42_21195 [Pelomonas sp. HMWF004]